MQIETYKQARVWWAGYEEGRNGLKHGNPYEHASLEALQWREGFRAGRFVRVKVLERDAQANTLDVAAA